MTFIHRVVRKKGNIYLLKGDNATEADGLISGSNILGCVRIVEREGLRVFFGLGPERFLIRLPQSQGNPFTDNSYLDSFFHNKF